MADEPREALVAAEPGPLAVPAEETVVRRMAEAAEAASGRPSAASREDAELEDEARAERAEAV
eukprot:9882731-Alexandrium_andersonii.AAC.1